MNPTRPVAAPSELPLGWRFIKMPGSDEYVQVPLTRNDLLHPKEGDVIPERISHNEGRDYLKRAFQTRPLGPGYVQVVSDLLIDFNLEGIEAVAPDVAIIAGLTGPLPSSLGRLDLAKSGGRCLLVVEIVSPEYRENDVEKKYWIYHQANVPLYVVIDQQHVGGPLTLVGYQWRPQGYERLALDEQGRLVLEPLGVRLRIEGQRTVCEDAETGREIADYVEMYREHEALERRDQEREREIEAAIDRAHAAERQVREEARAREEAERELAALREQVRLLQGGDPAP